MDQENVKGSTAAFCTFSPFKSRLERWMEWAVFKGAPGATEAVRERRFLHYAYFVRISPRQLKRAQIAAHERLRAGALLFISAYNGSAELYFRGFSQKLSQPMNRLWEGCTGWKGAEIYENLDRFIQTYRRRSQFHFNAYEETSSNVRGALRLRDELDELIATTYDDPSAFLAGYRRAAQIAWGNQAEGWAP